MASSTKVNGISLQPFHLLVSWRPAWTSSPNGERSATCGCCWHRSAKFIAKFHKPRGFSDRMIHLNYLAFLNLAVFITQNGSTPVHWKAYAPGVHRSTKGTVGIRVDGALHWEVNVQPSQSYLHIIYRDVHRSQSSTSGLGVGVMVPHSLAMSIIHVVIFGKVRLTRPNYGKVWSTRL